MQYSTSYRFLSPTLQLLRQMMSYHPSPTANHHTQALLEACIVFTAYPFIVGLLNCTHARMHAHTHTQPADLGAYFISLHISVWSQFSFAKSQNCNPVRIFCFTFCSGLSSLFYLQRLSTFNHQNESHIQHMSQWETHVSYLSLTLCSREGTQNSASLICCL